jgi:hypothetical protein
LLLLVAAHFQIHSNFTTTSPPLGNVDVQCGEMHAAERGSRVPAVRVADPPHMRACRTHPITSLITRCHRQVCPVARRFVQRDDHRKPLQRDKCLLVHHPVRVSRWWWQLPFGSTTTPPSCSHIPLRQSGRCVRPRARARDALLNPERPQHGGLLRDDVCQLGARRGGPEGRIVLAPEQRHH